MSDGHGHKFAICFKNSMPGSKMQDKVGAPSGTSHLMCSKNIPNSKLNNLHNINFISNLVTRNDKEHGDLHFSIVTFEKSVLKF